MLWLNESSSVNTAAVSTWTHVCTDRLRYPVNFTRRSLWGRSSFKTSRNASKLLAQTAKLAVKLKRGEEPKQEGSAPLCSFGFWPVTRASLLTMSAVVNDSRKRSKKRYGGGHNKRWKGSRELEVGMQGILITCNMNERKCTAEAFNLLNEYADQLFGPEKVSSGALYSPSHAYQRSYVSLWSSVCAAVQVDLGTFILPQLREKLNI